MTALLRPQFPHRNNNDGSYDSICSVCYETVASSGIERQLTPMESTHRCNPVRLYQLSRGCIAFEHGSA